MSADQKTAIKRAVHVNGAQECLAAASIAELLSARDLAPDSRGIAIALNGRVVPRALWAETALRDGDAIEIVRAMQGG
jgi:sulfur carrier protein